MPLFTNKVLLEWASLVAQLVKNLPAMQETLVSLPELVISLFFVYFFASIMGTDRQKTKFIVV